MLRRINLKIFLFSVTTIFALSCSNQDATQSNYQESNKNYVSRVKAGDFAPGQLEAHYLKHGNEFGNITKEQYLENARALLDASPSKDILEKTRANGDILHYRVSTGEFAVMTRAGRIRTYFKADYRYWMRQ
jgi:pyocin large subunit-like protein